ncbi:uncharacterized protein PV07_11842 [Cladophialophora immunda]|uniref:Zn(2)-C6 fungal-type domain-containing protein n=2 Tax=Cladophialophora immunda TaxID=569365 RepID=A0A0D2BZB2_9EURO|nr:uncharacterized protein PV07_11842 [Cladophialophora immunda]KIW23660.1 hypothetical protein PV07_11842 [Cladophialophora immunda]
MPSRPKSSSLPAADSAGRKPIKRPRPSLNCAECRRLKIKCDRQVPCANCVKRACAHVCPDQTLGSVKSMRHRFLQLEQGRTSPPAGPVLGSDLNPLDEAAGPSSRPQPSPNINFSTVAAEPGEASTPQAPEQTPEVGTLVMNSDGRSKFIGQSASFQWLRDETNGHLETRPPSPTRPHPSEGFPFHNHPPVDFPSLWSHLPPKDEAMYLVGCFHRHIAWNGSPILEDDLLTILRWLYTLSGIAPAKPSMAFQRLGLVYIVLALGSMLNMEVTGDDLACKEFYELSQECLVSGKFLIHNSLTTVQTLSLMAKFTAYADMRDVAWQIRGMATRIMLAMGLHRDGESWNLSSKDLNDRRRTFWETYSTDVLISGNWGRPSGLHPDLFDTQLPEDYNHGTGFEKQRCRLAMLAQEALQESLKIRSNYDKLREIWRKTLEVESATPFELRNRTALMFMVSKYPTLAEVEANTPPASTNLRLVFQSHDLIDVASTLVLSMFRPYFVHAVQEPDPSKSVYAEAYFTVIERSSMLIANLRSLHSTFPLISTRHWFFWTHAFAGAVTLATICIANPGSPLVDQVMNDLNSIISLYTSIRPDVSQMPIKRNLQWLLELRAKGLERIEAFRAGQVPENTSPASASEEMAEHLLLVGWRKKLVELGHRDADTVPDPVDPNVMSSTGLTFETPGYDFMPQLLGLTSEGPQFITPFDSTDMLDFEFNLQ